MPSKPTEAVLDVNKLDATPLFVVALADLRCGDREVPSVLNDPRLTVLHNYGNVRV